MFSSSYYSPSDVQPRPIRKTAPRGFSLLRSCFLLIIVGRSLREGIRVKIRASTIFTLILSLAELLFEHHRLI